MPPSRKPAVPPVPQALDNAAIRAASRDLTVVGTNLQQIEERFGLAPYDRRRVIDEAQFYIEEGARAMLELGKRLVQMKEAEPYGDFMDCLRAIGIEQSIANKMMKAAVRFAGAPDEILNRIPNLGRAKLYELAMLDDDEIRELSRGGSVAGLTLDEFERMGLREARAALRSARAELQARDDLLDKKNKKIDELDTKLTTKRRHALDAAAEARAAMLESISEQTHAITTAVARLDELLHEADAQGMRLHLPTNDALCISLTLARQALATLIARHGIIDPTSIPAEIFAPAKA